jgi:hypothetical protein
MKMQMMDQYVKGRLGSSRVWMVGMECEWMEVNDDGLMDESMVWESTKLGHRKRGSERSF